MSLYEWLIDHCERERWCKCNKCCWRLFVLYSRSERINENKGNVTFVIKEILWKLVNGQLPFHKIYYTSDLIEKLGYKIIKRKTIPGETICPGKIYIETDIDMYFFKGAIKKI